MSSDMRISRWRMPNKRVDISVEWKDIATRFYWLLPHFRQRPTRVWQSQHCPTSETQMSATKQEVEITFERKQMAKGFQRLPPHFRVCPTRIWHCLFVCLFVCLLLNGPSARFRPFEGQSMVESRWLQCLTAISQTGVTGSVVSCLVCSVEPT